MTHRNFGLVLVETDAGITGVGETSVNFPHWALTERRATIEEGIRELLVGEDPLRIEGLWDKMYSALSKLGLLWGKGAIMSAIGGADIALWDIAGQAHGVPVYQLLGGLVHERIPLYATGFSMDEPARAAKACVEQGYKAVKLRAGFDPEQDLANVTAVRDAIGADVDLMVDVNMGWDRRLAARMIEELEDFGLYWIEEPLRADDVEGLADLALMTHIPIAAGENAFDLGDFKTLLMAEAVDFIMPDPTRAGGLSECKRVCAMARAWGLRVSPHHYGSDVGFAAALHLLASISNGDYMLRDVSPTPLREQVLLEPIEIASGCAVVPQRPGLGIKLNHEFIAQYTYESR